MLIKLPTFSTETIEHPIYVKHSGIVYQNIEILFPSRLNAMVLDQSGILPNSKGISTGGEVVISIKKYVNVKIKASGDNNGDIMITGNCDRNVLIKRAYILMCSALGSKPSLAINVMVDIEAHSGLGSSGAIIAAVCIAINEMYDNPINTNTLLHYIMANYGEEYEKKCDSIIQKIPCLGGSISTGLFDGGIQVLAGNGVLIEENSLEATVVIAIPKNYKILDAKSEIEKHIKYLCSVPLEKMTIMNKALNENVAYEMLNKVLPELKEDNISELCSLIYKINFENYLYGLNDYKWCCDNQEVILDEIRNIYINKKCIMLGKSSAGPAFFALTNNENDTQLCISKFTELAMNVIVTSVCNEKYQVIKE